MKFKCWRILQKIPTSGSRRGRLSKSNGVFLVQRYFSLVIFSWKCDLQFLREVANKLTNKQTNRQTDRQTDAS